MEDSLEKFRDAVRQGDLIRLKEIRMSLGDRKCNAMLFSPVIFEDALLCNQIAVF